MWFVLTAAAGASELRGQASVIDGDTLGIHGTRIRLWGIDAPESPQLCRGEDSLPYRCGAKAANELDRFVERRPVRQNGIAEIPNDWSKILRRRLVWRSWLPIEKRILLLLRR
ncbi:thermonuclease family protein [Bradyrhizobium ottawaense]|uniref:thermonuclease family protein n=1 Tax=Bradyrhizobium ottawaense TaxID=931866 RepID=UPI003F9F42F5